MNTSLPLVLSGRHTALLSLCVLGAAFGAFAQLANPSAGTRGDSLWNDVGRSPILTGSPVDAPAATGQITLRGYRSIPGWSLQELRSHPRFPGQPSSLEYPSQFEAPMNAGNFYGLQMVGFVHPPVTGDYTFYLAADHVAELFLSQDDNPANKRRIASELWPNHAPRQWTGGQRPVGAAPESIFSPTTRYIEAEDFDFGGGQWLENTAIGMDGPYSGLSYAGLGTGADAGIDWFEVNPANFSPAFRADTGVETWSTSDTEMTARGDFNVSMATVVSWNDVGDWRNYTRNFGSPQTYYVFARMSSGGGSITAQLDQVTSGRGTSSQTTLKLGEFRGPASGSWNLFSFVPLVDANQQIAQVTLEGLQTLRFTLTDGNGDPDYLAFLPVTSGPPPEVVPSNQSRRISLVAGQRYYIEAQLKEAVGPDHLAVGWQMPNTPPPTNGDAPIPGRYLEPLIDPSLVLTPPTPLSLGNLVFFDANENGMFDPDSEQGVDGVVVRLYQDYDGGGWLGSEDGAPIATTTTSNGGQYRFDGLTTDTYLVEVARENMDPGGPLAAMTSSLPTHFANADVDNTDDGFHRFDLRGVVSEGGVYLEDGREPTLDGDGDPYTNLSVDFGFRPPGGPTAIGNLVFRDANNDGLFDPAQGDSGIDGVLIHVVRDNGNGMRDDADGPVVGSTTTAGGGLYQFQQLPMGDYWVELDPSNFFGSGALAGWMPSTSISPVTNNDIDNDSNGYLLPGFSVLANPVRLEIPGEPTSEDGDPHTNLTIDFGFVPQPGLRLGDLVWDDQNANGLRDANEPGMANVALVARLDQGDGRFDNGESWIQETRTDSSGHYAFHGLAPGIYFVVVREDNFRLGGPLYGKVTSSEAAAANNDVDDDNNGSSATPLMPRGLVSTPITLAAGTEPDTDGDDADGNRTVDFGVYTPANPPVLMLGGRVFADTNADSIFGPDEFGIPNVTVTTFLDNGDGIFQPYFPDGFLYAVSTDPSGRFLFDGLAPGDYWAQVEGGNFTLGAPLYGRLSSPGAANANDDAPADDNGIDQILAPRYGVHSSPISLGNGTEPTDDGDGPDSNQTLGFGFVTPAQPPVLKLGGTFFQDANSNGIQDANEGWSTALYIAVFLDDGDEIYEPNADDLHVSEAFVDPFGRFEVSSLPPGGYWTWIGPWHFNAGGALFGKRSSPGVGLPDLDVDGDDSGIDNAFPEQQGILAPIIHLSNSTEPTHDGDDADSNQTLDFGFVDLPAGGPNLTVGGSLFRDDDNNGIRTEGETTAAFVTVELWYDTGDGVLGEGDLRVNQSFTDSAGSYRFGNLSPGDYIVAIPRQAFLPFNPLAGTRSSTGNGPAPDPDDDVANDDNGSEVSAFGASFYGVASAPISLQQDAEPTTEDADPRTNLTLDFGFHPASGLAIAGRLFRDENNNGALDAAETGVTSAQVEVWHDNNNDNVLTDGDGYVNSTVTAADGSYRVEQLIPGNYFVVVRYSNFLPLRPLNGLRSSTGNDPAPSPNNDLVGDDNGFEFGMLNHVFFGARTHGVALQYDSEPDTSADGDDTNSNATVDLGFYPGPTGSLGDLVFRDENNNGLRDPSEPGIQGAQVRVFLDNGDGALGIFDEDLGTSVITAADGSYQFAGLPDGDYLVVLPYENWWPGQALNGLRSSTGNGAAPDPNLDSTENDDNGDEGVYPYLPSLQVASRPFFVRDGTTTSTIDFGFYPGPTVRVGGTVFFDSANNGLRDSDDSPISNVAVQLRLDSNGDGVASPFDNFAAQTRTDADGHYLFSGMLPGDYLVWISSGEHFQGGALSGLRTSTGNDPAPDPDNDQPGDDNGAETTDFNGAWNGTGAGTVTLGIGNEPDTAIDGDDSNGNQTVDFGFRALVGATFVVNTADDHDDGSCDAADCTLREAILAANQHPGTDTLVFAIPGPGVHTIQPLSPLPLFLESAVVDATTQPGYTDRPIIELDGSQAGFAASGLVFTSGFSEARGLIIHRFEIAAVLLAGSSNRIAGCFIGTDASGTVGLGNGQTDNGAIRIDGDGNLVGGSEILDRNLISGNRVAIQLFGNRNRIEGNFIGTDVTGTAATPNTGFSAIGITGSDNRIGGSDPGAGNLISGNGDPATPWAGAAIIVNSGNRNRIQGNTIGTDLSGSLALPNNTGILFFGGEDNLVGGLEPGSGNLISGNRMSGIRLDSRSTVQGNRIGTDRSGTTPIPNAQAGIELTGSQNLVGGFVPEARNLISGNQSFGIVACGYHTVSNRIAGNWIGLDATGTIGLGNGGIKPVYPGTGIMLCGNLNIIGGPEVGAGNVISGNGQAIELRGNQNGIQGNLMGTDPSGTSLVANFNGITLVDAASDNLIGGALPGFGNVIGGAESFNGAIALHGQSVIGTRILGNRIGTDITGTIAFPNSFGVTISEASNTAVGGVAPGEANLIANSINDGVYLVGFSAVNNSIRGNAIHSNGNSGWNGFGIRLENQPANDPWDIDEGANHLQNHPVLLQASASPGATLIGGRLDGSPNSTFVIDLYGNAACDPSGFGEGQQYLGESIVTTDASGFGTFSFLLPAGLPVGSSVSATATDPAGNTSAFGPCQTVESDTPPTVLSATTRGSDHQVFITFSEPLDSTSASDPAHYRFSPELSVLAATLQADQRTVVLDVSGLTPDAAYTLAISGVRDLSVPPNEIAANTSVALVNSQGVLSRLVYRNIVGSLVRQLTDHSNFPDAPSEITYEFTAEAPSNIGDNYGQKLAGYLIPPTTGDYRFFIASDDHSELWLSTDANPANKVRVARLSYWTPNQRGWNQGPLNQPTEDVLVPGALFVEAEDFDFGGGQFIADQPIGMTGPYTGGAYAGLGSAADEGIDFHEYSVDAAAQNYRVNTGVEMYVLADVLENDHGKLQRGGFAVTTSHKLGWNAEGEWWNYTRDFPAQPQDYWVYAHIASGSGPMAFQLGEVTDGRGTATQSVSALGEFHSPPTSDWDNFVLVPLTDGNGEPVRLSLSGLRTLRMTVLPGAGDFDYLAFVPATTKAPTTRPENHSPLIHLVAGQRYYLEVLMKEWSANDHLALTWQRPGGPAPEDGADPIPGEFLSSLKNSGPATIAVQPASTSILEREVATFTVDLDGTPPYRIQWYRDGNPIPDATNFLYTTQVSFADSGTRFHATVENAFGHATSDEAILTVLADTTPPALIAATGSHTLDRITLRFSESLDPVSASEPSNYTVNAGQLPVLTATLLPDGTSVRLTTALQAQGISWVVTVTGVRDTAHQPNTIAGANQSVFTSWVQSRGYALREAYLNIPGTTLEDLRASPKFPGEPDLVGAVTSFELPINVGDNYGARLSALVIPPIGGTYQLFMASDDQGELWLSSDASPANAMLVANEPAWNNSRAWTTTFNRNEGDPENRTDPVPFEGNFLYHLTGLMKEAGGGDHLAATWQLPDGPLPIDGDSPIPGSQLIGFVNPDDPTIVVMPYLVETSPSFAAEGGQDLVVSIHGYGFLAGAIVQWNGEARPTTFVDGTRLDVVIPATDLAPSASSAPFRTARLQVFNANGSGSNPLGFTIAIANSLLDAETAIANPGESATASTAPDTAGDAGVTAAATNPDGSPLVVTVATYANNPTSLPLFDSGGGFTDIAVDGADAGDRLDAFFYYPSWVVGNAEDGLQLLWFNGTSWLPVIGSGGIAVSKDVTDNLDGTVSGGRFFVRLDASSQPTILDLSGTVFAITGQPANQPPVATDDQMVDLFPLPTGGLKIAHARLLSNDRDPERGKLTIIGVSTRSANGSAVTFDGQWVTYARNRNPGNDSFTYTVADPEGATATATVIIRRTNGVKISPQPPLIDSPWDAN
ncbi:MAG: CSLREA domain-containing protein [Verrucomicrobiales bacterium]|nr:CSLREA domain-containing protein [Verrucomicrobiales bacterium]